MKYSNKVIVHIPTKEFINKLDKPDNIKQWQRRLLPATPIEGEQVIPAAFRKQSQLYLKDINNFAENGTSLAG